jgi:hypothetical protein
MSFDWNFDFGGIFRRPTKPTTSAGWVVLAWAAILLLTAFGGLALFLASRLPAAEFADAAELRSGAWKAFGFAAGIFVVKSVVERLTDD